MLLDTLRCSGQHGPTAKGHPVPCVSRARARSSFLEGLSILSAVLGVRRRTAAHGSEKQQQGLQDPSSLILRPTYCSPGLVPWKSTVKPSLVASILSLAQ